MSNSQEKAQNKAAHAELAFLHLSDIHFHSGSGDTFDLDENLRNELLMDAGLFAQELHTLPDGVLVTGDIAFSGAHDEYVRAKEFLVELCDRLGRTIEIVRCVPGNHDVDRRCIADSALLLTQQTALRQLAANEINDRLTKCIKDRLACDLVFHPLTEYNRFAASFRGVISANNPFWEDSFTLNDGSTLNVRGLNSTIASNSNDDHDDTNNVLGEYQIPLRTPGILHLAMCHHPPTCWRDQDIVEHILDTRVQIQLFGHKHAQRVTRIDNTLRLSAGAVHPVRRVSGWEPRYNWLSLYVTREGEQRHLEISVYPRVWNTSRQKFVPDQNSCNGENHLKVELPLDPWTPPERSDLPLETDAVAPAESAPIPGELRDTPTQNSPHKTIMNAERTLTYRFFDLPHIVRLRIARRLNLYQDEDEGLHDFELFARVFQRAIDASVLPDLWDRIEEEHNDRRYPENPFRR